MTQFRVVEQYGIFDGSPIRWQIQQRTDEWTGWETVGETTDMIAMKTCIAHIERTGRLETIYTITPKVPPAPPVQPLRDSS